MFAMFVTLLVIPLSWNKNGNLTDFSDFVWNAKNTISLPLNCIWDHSYTNIIINQFRAILNVTEPPSHWESSSDGGSSHSFPTGGPVRTEALTTTRFPPGDRWPWGPPGDSPGPSTDHSLTQTDRNLMHRVHAYFLEPWGISCRASEMGTHG